MSATPWPSEITLDRTTRTLTIDFDDGAHFVFSAEFLRVLSPSAEVQGHSPDQKVTVPGKKNVGFVGAEEVGNYALKIIFDDRHDSGLYTWQALYQMGLNRDSLWQGYLDELAAKGLHR